jgi:hypothetical protein
MYVGTFFLRKRCVQICEPHCNIWSEYLSPGRCQPAMIRVARFFLTHNTKTGQNYTYQMSTKLLNGHKLYQMAVTYSKSLHSKALQNIPNLGFFILKYTIWQPWFLHIWLLFRANGKRKVARPLSAEMRTSRGVRRTRTPVSGAIWRRRVGGVGCFRCRCFRFRCRFRVFWVLRRFMESVSTII